MSGLEVDRAAWRQSGTWICPVGHIGHIILVYRVEVQPYW